MWALRLFLFSWQCSLFWRGENSDSKGCPRQSPHDHLIPHPQLRPWTIERTRTVLNELAAWGEQNAVVPAHKTKARDTPEKQTDTTVLVQILLHQTDQPRHLIRKRPALKLLRQGDG